MQNSRLPSATASTSVADILERVLDKGVVVAGDIRIKLVDIELLTIQLRLVICSIDRAKEIGIDWWNFGLENQSKAITEDRSDATDLAKRLASLEEKISQAERAA